MNEVWIVEKDGEPCELSDGVLWKLNLRARPTAFLTCAAAERAIDKTIIYVEQEKLNWGTNFKPVRFSRG